MFDAGMNTYVKRSVNNSNLTVNMIKNLIYVCYNCYMILCQFHFLFFPIIHNKIRYSTNSGSFFVNESQHQNKKNHPFVQQKPMEICVFWQPLGISSLRQVLKTQQQAAQALNASAVAAAVSWMEG